MASLVIMEMNSEVPVRQPLILIGMMLSIGESLATVDNSVASLLRAKTRSPHDPSLPLLHIFAKEVKSVHQAITAYPLLLHFDLQ